MKQLLYFLAIISLLVSGCRTIPQKDTIYQLSTVNALIGGAYDSDTAYSEVLQHGNFGIGVFNGLDGEMILLDGQIYQMKADGKVYKPKQSIKTPFATICQFTADKKITIQEGTDYNALKEIIDSYIPDQSQFCAIKINGRFKAIKTRRIPRQKKPYPPIQYISKNAPIFDLTNVSGTIIGFRNPSYAKGILSTGYHLHFIADDKSQGGHVMSLEVEKAECELDFINKLNLILTDKFE